MIYYNYTCYINFQLIILKNNTIYLHIYLKISIPKCLFKWVLIFGEINCKIIISKPQWGASLPTLSYYHIILYQLTFLYFPLFSRRFISLFLPKFLKFSIFFTFVKKPCFSVFSTLCIMSAFSSLFKPPPVNE